MNWIAIAIAALALVKLLEVVRQWHTDLAAAKFAESLHAQTSRAFALNEKVVADKVGVRLPTELATVTAINKPTQELEEP